MRVFSNKIEVISYSGADPSIRQNDLNAGVVRARRYRNRRVGEFLKELGLTEGKGTGIPTIKQALEDNGSPPALFDTDGEDRRPLGVVYVVPERMTNGTWNLYLIAVHPEHAIVVVDTFLKYEFWKKKRPIAAHPIKDCSAMTSPALYQLTEA